MPARAERRFLDRTTPPHVVTLVLLAGTGALSMNVFLPSLPAMTEYFDTDYAVMQLSVALYLAVNAVLQLFIGPISDRFGRRAVILGTFATFNVATVGCLLAPTVAIFLAFRMLQAVIVTGLVLSRAIVRDMVPEAQAASMIGYVTMGMALVPMVGPTIGGVLDQAFGWQASFLMLLIVGLGVMALAWADQGETAGGQQPNILAQFRQYPQLFVARRFWGYTLATAFSSGSFFALVGGAPFVGTDVFGLAPAAVGFYFGITAVGYMVGNFLSGRYSVQIGVNPMMLAGALSTAVGVGLALALLALDLGHPAAFFGPMAVVGIGNGMVLPNGTAGLLSVRPHLAGTASGLSGAMRIGGGAALSALAGAMLVPGGGPWPLLAIMLATSIGSILATAYVLYIDRIAGPLEPSAAE